jgi:hypothetical protein
MSHPLLPTTQVGPGEAVESLSIVLLAELSGWTGSGLQQAMAGGRALPRAPYFAARWAAGRRSQKCKCWVRLFREATIAPK